MEDFAKAEIVGDLVLKIERIVFGALAAAFAFGDDIPDGLVGVGVTVHGE